MFRKDYMQRRFEEFGKFLALLMGLKNQKQWEQLERQINESASKFTAVEISLVEKINDDHLISELADAKQLKEEQLKMLADLLYEKGIAYMKLLGENEARNAFTKALLLYDYVQSVSLETDFSLDMHFKIKSIRQLLG